MHWIDWAIVITVIVFITAMAWRTKKYTKSVADFLAADRCVGRYLITMCGGMSSLGAISFIAMFEMRYEAGFVPSWWFMMMLPTGLLVALSGWVVYRFRQTRALTLAQFFEIRYSKRFRIFAGLLIFLSGLLNFGIFPSVGARFFIYFCGLPPTFDLLGMQMSSYVLVLIALLSIALFFCFLGGQIAVIVTDFFQSAFCNIVFLVLVLFLLFKFDWTTIIEGLKAAPLNASMIHPFETSKVENFNFWYFIIALIGSFYATMAWQGSSAYNCSAKSPHEARMGKILGTWREIALVLVITLLPICAYVVMHHSDFASEATEVTKVLNSISQDSQDVVRGQMTVPVVLSQMMPVGIIGAFCAVMFAAFVSTHDTYLHSWGTIFIQDVILPFRKRPFTTKQHLWLLRFSIFGVAVFAFCFSLVFRQTQHIFMFWALTGAIWMGGAGAVIIGGLYWPRGTTAAAWAALITGSSLAISALIIEQVWKSLYDKSFPVNGQWMYFISIVSAVLVYIVVSVLGKKKQFNLDAMLHRGKYAIEEEHRNVTQKSDGTVGLNALKMGKDATRSDKVIYILFLIYSLGWFTAFIIFTVYNLIWEVSTEAWASFWHFFVWLNVVLATITTVWYIVGGIVDLKYMFKVLRSAKRNELDDGMVVDHQNLDEVNKTDNDTVGPVA